MSDLGGIVRSYLARRKRAEGGAVDADDMIDAAREQLWTQPARPVAPRVADPMMPDVGDPLVGDGGQFSAGTRSGNRLFGTGGEERFQTWPEKMVRSGTSLAGDILSGNQAVLPPGLRREDYTDIPPPTGPTGDSTWLGRQLGIAPVAAQPNDPMMERAQDMAGLAGGQTLLTAGREAGAAAAGAGRDFRVLGRQVLSDSAAPGAPLAALEHAPKFYSSLERAVEAVPQPRMSGEQWLGTLSNKGAKAEELQWTGLGEYLAAKKGEPVTKAEVQEHLGANAVKLNERESGWQDVTKDPGWNRLMAANEALGREHDRLSGQPNTQETQARIWDINDQMNANHDAMRDMEDRRRDTQYSSYQLPGGENYRERLLTLPQRSPSHFAVFKGEQQVSPDGFNTAAEARQWGVDNRDGRVGLSVREVGGDSPYRSSHWPDDPNVLVHRRSNERTYDIPFSPEEAAAAEAHRGATSQIEALRNQQRDVFKEINAAVKPLEEARKAQIMADFKAGIQVGKKNFSEVQRALEEVVDFPQIKPLQDKLQALRAQEDQIRSALGPEPKQKTGRALHIEEIQSDWHQTGRKQGYKGDVDVAALERKMNVGFQNLVAEIRSNQPNISKRAAESLAMDLSDKIRDGEHPGSFFTKSERELGQKWHEDMTAYMKASSNSAGTMVPNAPFRKNWHELALKDAIREAAEKGHDRISWTPGEAQAKRYDLSQHVQDITVVPHGDGGRTWWPTDTNGRAMHSITTDKDGVVTKAGAPYGDIVGKSIDDVIGKDVAEKGHAATEQTKLSGADLSVGGEGMKGFYDKIVPDYLNKIGKAHGVKVEKGETVADKAGWHITPPDQTTSGKWMVKSNDYNSKGKLFDTEAEAREVLNTIQKREPVHYMDIPQSLKDQVLKKGFSLFEDSATVGAPLSALEQSVRKITPEKGTTPNVAAGAEARLDVGPGMAGSPGGAEGLRAAELQAQRWAGERAPLEGLPRDPQKVDGQPFIPGPNARAHDVAEHYMAGRDFGAAAPKKYHPVDVEHARSIAQAFDEMAHAPNDPKVRAAYQALADETLAQYNAIVEHGGLKVTPVNAADYPYHGNPRAVVKDVADNNHMAFFKTDEGFGSAPVELADHPLLKPSGIKVGDHEMLYNDLFRVVHDYFGHVKNGYGFRGAGEDNAWRAHAAMYSPEARRAMTTETRGQNSWLNYGPHGDFNRTANATDTIYAPQKIGLLPDWVMSDRAKGSSLFEDSATTGAPLAALEKQSRISTRLPTGKKNPEDALGAERLKIDMAAMEKDPGLFAHNVGLVAQYPNLPKKETRGKPTEVAKRFIDYVSDNLLHLYDQVPENIRERSKKWYEGGNKIANDLATEHGAHPNSSAGVIAALSPQKDWFQNVDLARRVHDIHFNKRDEGYSSEMATTSKRIFGDPKFKTGLDRIKGKTYGELDDIADKAMWLRLHDEAHNPRSHRLVTPEGEYGDVVRNANGAPSGTGWGSLVEIGKAIQSLEAKGDVSKISSLMGERHKVRNFYNNLIDPHSPHGDVTIDTHAVAAGLMRPLSGNSMEVAHNFGNYPGADLPTARSSAVTGVGGTYGLYADAYRKAAEARGITPREMQSVTWEAIRGLFQDTWKSSKKNTEAVDAIWRKYQKGLISKDDARTQITELAGGVTPPDWHQPGAGGRGPAHDEAGQHPADPQQLPADGVSGRAAEAVVGRAGSGAAAAPAPALKPGGEADPAVAPRAFKKWFGKSKAVDAKGEPLTVYRGEHGEVPEGGGFQSRLSSLSFSEDPKAASAYAMNPNRYKDVAVAPRVSPSHVKIEKPFINSPDDPFLDLSHVQKKLGVKEAMRIARKFKDAIEGTNNWEDFSDKYKSVADLLRKKPKELKNLYFDTYQFLDDPVEIAKLKKLGYDGAIHGGNGETHGTKEYRVFDKSQVKSAIKGFARGGKVMSYPSILQHFADGGGVDDTEETGVPVFDPTKLAAAQPKAPVFDPAKLAAAKPTQPKTIGDRISSMWENASPGGLPWMAKELVEGIKGSVDYSKRGAQRFDPPKEQTEADVFLQDRAQSDAVSSALRATQFLTPSAPKGTGGIFAAPMRDAAAAKLVSPEAQANRELADEFGFKLSRGQATKDLDQIRYEDMAARDAYGKEAQDKASGFFNKQYEDIQSGTQQVGQELARGEQPLGSPVNAGAALNREVADSAARSAQMRDEVIARAEQAAAARRGEVADRGRTLDEGINQGRPPIAPREAGEAVNTGVRGAAAQDKAYYQAKYEDVARQPGEFQEGTFQGVGSRIRNDLFHAEEPVEITENTRVANHAIQALDNWSQPNIMNAADPKAAFADPTSVVTLKNVDTFMKRLSGFYRQAERGSEDQRAVGRIMSEFGNQVESAMADGMFSGDPAVYGILREAKAAFARYQRTYKPQGADEVGNAMRRIVERNATPEETANMIIGSGQVGNAALPVKIANRLQEVLGADSPEYQAIRQAMWQKASQVRNKAGDIDAQASARSIEAFANSTLGRNTFPQERATMLQHAQGIRNLDRIIESMPETAAAESARSLYQEAFSGDSLSGSQRAVFRRMVNGTATPEETAQVMFNAIGSGNPGDAARALRAIMQIVGPESPVMGTVRQGVWQKLTQEPFGKDQKGQQKMVQAVSEFVNGKGGTIARALYSPEERRLMNRFADAVKLTIIPKYARTNSDTTPAMLAAIRKYAGVVGTALGSIFHGGMSGGAEGYALTKAVDFAGSKIGVFKDRKKLNDSLEDVLPKPGRQLPRVIVTGAPRVMPATPNAEAKTISNALGNNDNPYAP